MAAQPSLLGPHLTEGRLNYERRLTFRKAMLRSGLSSVRLASSNSKADIKSDLRLNRVLKTKLVFLTGSRLHFFHPGSGSRTPGVLRHSALRPVDRVEKFSGGGLRRFLMRVAPLEAPATQACVSAVFVTLRYQQHDNKKF